MPALGPLGIGDSATCQVRPKSRGLNTRDTAPPPVAKNAWPEEAVRSADEAPPEERPGERPGVETRQVPLAAKANSPSRAVGIPRSGRTDQEWPPSRVARMRNFPLTGSERARPWRR